MTDDPMVSVIVPTWNGLPLLKRCLESLWATEGPPFEVVVVDDASTDDTWTWLGQHPDQRLHRLRNDTNLGFAQSMNAGFRVARGQWFVPLNNDTRVHPTFVTELVRGANSGVDMVAPRVLLQGQPVLDSAGILPLGDGGSVERGRNCPADSPEFLASTEVFGPSASACLYSRRMIATTAGFDGDFHAYYEDVDLAWRARHAGYQCIYWPAAVVEHHHSATWGRISDRKLFLLERNRLWNLWKNYPIQWVASEPLIRFPTMGAMLSGGTLGSEVGVGLRNMGLAHLGLLLTRADVAAWKEFGKMWQKRREIHRDTKLSKREAARWLRSKGREPVEPRKFRSSS